MIFANFRFFSDYSSMTPNAFHKRMKLYICISIRKQRVGEYEPPPLPHFILVKQRSVGIGLKHGLMKVRKKIKWLKCLCLEHKVRITICFCFLLKLNSHGSQLQLTGSRIVHLNCRAGSSFPVSVCTVSPGVNKADT